MGSVLAWLALAALPVPRLAAQDTVRVRPPAPGPLRPVQFPPFQEARLSNGVDLLVVENHEQPTVSISDDGPRIAGEDRMRIFERFHRLLGNSASGTGLGLAIAREIARIHRATIGLREDHDGVGNVFSVTFPTPRPPAVD